MTCVPTCAILLDGETIKPKTFDLHFKETASMNKNNKDLLKKLKNIYNGDIIFAEDFARYTI